MRKSGGRFLTRLAGALVSACLLMNMTGLVCRAEEVDLYAASAALIDADSGRVLYEKQGHEPMAMASTTKIMTCILVLEEGSLDDKAQVSAYAASMPKVKLYVSQGEEYEVRSLLFSLMLESHNDSAVVLAEYIGRRYLSEELRQKDTADFTVEESRQAVKAFADLMNAKARELGCEDTWFITPNGLDAEEDCRDASQETVRRDHHTTAVDLARIMAYCIKESPGRDVFREITRTESYSFCENGRSVTCTNHNAFLNMMEGAFSGKTGFTNKAGYCYVGALERDGRTFIVALLACGWPNNKTYKWSDSRELFEYGLEHYSFRRFLNEDTLFDASGLKPIAVKNGQTEVLGDHAEVELGIREREKEDFWSGDGMLMKEDERIQVEYDLADGLCAPVKAGTKVGEIRYSVDGKVYLTETIVTRNGVDEIEMPWCMEQVFRRFILFR